MQVQMQDRRRVAGSEKGVKAADIITDTPKQTKVMDLVLYYTREFLCRVAQVFLHSHRDTGWRRVAGSRSREGAELQGIAQAGRRRRQALGAGTRCV